MKKTKMLMMVVMTLVLTLVGCSIWESDNSAVAEVSHGYKSNTIDFEENQLYGVASLGYDDMYQPEEYLEKYLHDNSPPVHYISHGEYYLIIPRYDDMSLAIYKNDMMTNTSTLQYTDTKSSPFIIQCNESDIFSNITITFTHEGEEVSFSPYISAKDGSVVIGDRGVNLTIESQQ